MESQSLPRIRKALYLDQGGRGQQSWSVHTLHPARPRRLQVPGAQCVEGHHHWHQVGVLRLFASFGQLLRGPRSTSLQGQEVRTAGPLVHVCSLCLENTSRNSLPSVFFQHFRRFLETFCARHLSPGAFVNTNLEASGLRSLQEAVQVLLMYSNTPVWISALQEHSACICTRKVWRV